MKGNHNQVDDHNYKEIKKAKRDFYRNVSEMKALDSLATHVKDWENRFGHLAIGMPSIYEIEQKQREHLINAMFYNQTAKVVDKEIDTYLQWKVAELTTL